MVEKKSDKELVFSGVQPTETYILEITLVQLKIGLNYKKKNHVFFVLLIYTQLLLQIIDLKLRSNH